MLSVNIFELYPFRIVIVIGIIGLICLIALLSINLSQIGSKFFFFDKKNVFFKCNSKNLCMCVGIKRKNRTITGRSLGNVTSKSIYNISGLCYGQEFEYEENEWKR